MSLHAQSGSAASLKTDLTIFIYPTFSKLKKCLSELDKDSKAAINTFIKEKDLTDKPDNYRQFSVIKGNSKRYGFYQLPKNGTVNDMRHAAGEIARKSSEYKKVAIDINPLEDGAEKAIAEGLVMGGYSCERYKSESSSKKAPSFTLCKDKKASTLANISAGEIIGQAVNQARDLANAPGNFLNPPLFVKEAKAKLKKPLKLTIIDEKKAAKLGMHSLLGVGKGSENPSYLVAIEYLPNKKEAPIALVGKGITFDTGGISLKPSNKMSEMKGDMGGAAAVFGAMQAIAQLKPKRNIVGILALAENMPDGTAQKPGDVVTAMNGKTIEITNTDAEGRLVLADALCYANKTYKPKAMVDIATLTGASVIALGDHASAVLGNNDKVINSLKDAGETTGDTLWQLPLFDAYLDYLKSDIADILNANEGRQAGTVTAAKFLEQFVDDTPWGHLDIACTMSNAATKGYKVKGMSGAGTRNLIEFALSY